MRISTAQVQELNKPVRQQVEQRIADHLQETYEISVSRAKLEQFVHKSVTRAIEHGLRDEADARDYAVLCMEFGLDFDRSKKTPWAKQILSDHSRTAHERLQELLAIADEVAT